MQLCLYNISEAAYSVTLRYVMLQKENLRSLSPQANYTDRAAAAGRRS